MSLLQLPPPLAPFAPFLDVFPLESALALGPLLQRLDAFVGPMRAAPQSGSVEPDGFDGLARRGSIERLLLSEWLLLEEAPLEFLRRFSGGESAYFQLARRDPHAARASLALFDCGPHVLGGPRLVQLAALLVLARRAQGAGATFRWGVWQKPGQWQGAVNRESLDWWLSLRGEGEPGEAQRAGWEEMWANEGADFSRDELWMVGSPQLKQFAPPRARFLEVRDELDPLALNRAVEAVLDGRALRLETPDEAIGARLLRDPFAQNAPKSNDKNAFNTLALDRGLVWAQSGWKLFARTRAGNLLVFSVPNSPSASVGAPKMVGSEENGHLIAAGRVGRANVAALVRPLGIGSTVVRFIAYGRGSTNWHEVEVPLNAPLDESELRATIEAPLGQIFAIGQGQSLAVLLSTRRFFVAEGAAQPKNRVSMREEHTGILGATLSENALSMLQPDAQGTGARFQTLIHNSNGLDWRPNSAEMPPVVNVAHSGFGAHADAPLWALGGLSEWQLRWSGQVTTIPASFSRAVVGCIVENGAPGLLLHARGEREIWFHTRVEEKKLFRFFAPIQSIAVCPFAPLLAVQGESELGVWSLQHGAWLLRARWE